MKKLKIKEAIVVEGRYDKAALANVVDTVIVDTAGFGVFSNKEKLALLRRLARARGLIVLTDSDGGGFLIRSFLKSAIDPKLVKHAYIPDVPGKEKRKKSGVPSTGCVPPLTKAEMYALGLAGQPDSAARRAALQKALDLPAGLTANGLLDVLNALVSREELTALVGTPPR